MNVPTVFGDVTTEEQAIDLRCYFKSLGAEISEERSSKGIEDDLKQIISVCHTCFKEPNEADIESVLNSIVAMLVIIPDKGEKLVNAFCDKVCKESGQQFSHIALRVLWLLFQSKDERSAARYNIYTSIIKVSKRIDMVHTIFKDIPSLKEQFSHSPLSTEKMQVLLRGLHDALLACKHIDLAAKVMAELLHTCSAQTAGKAKEDAQRCIVTALADPNTFLLDPLLALKPIRALERELIHTLLNIFVSEKLSTYMHFYKNHKDFVMNLGLDHNQNMKKMRILTFMQLAEISDELAFETIQKELQIPEADVENFIIEVLKTKLVSARMNQPEKKVHISSTMHRTFGMQQWHQLHDILQSWKTNLASIDNTMHSVVNTTGNRKPNYIPAI